MIKKGLKYRHVVILLACLITTCILIRGMRVPDISRPHRPKPTHRALLEKQVKPAQQPVKKTVDLVAIPAKPVEPCAVVSYRTHLLFAFQGTAVPPLFPNSSRAPPPSLT